MGLTKSQRAEFDNIAKHQPVFAGDLLSHQGCKELREMGLVMYYDDPEMISKNERGNTQKGGGYVLTEKGKELKSNLEASFEIMANGILYKPKNCQQKTGTYKDGCGKCGTGNLETCAWERKK